MKLRLLAAALLADQKNKGVALEKNGMVQSIHHHHYYPTSESCTSLDHLPHGPVQLKADVGFTPFSFGHGNEGLYAHQSFYFSYPYETRLLLTDCFCGGDRFLVYDSADPQAEYQATEGCDLANISCNYFSEDPQVCATSEGWCSSQWIRLQRGYHNITIEVLTSPFLSGTGYVILQSLCEGSPCCEPHCYYGINQCNQCD